MQAVKTLLNSENLYDPFSDPETNLHIFEEIESRMFIIGRRYKDIERLQEGMRVYVLAHEVLVDLEEVIESNYMLWKIVESVKMLRANITNFWFMVFHVLFI